MLTKLRFLTPVLCLSLLISSLVPRPVWALYTLTLDEARALENLGVSEAELRAHVMRGDVASLKQRLNDTPISMEGASEVRENIRHRGQEFADEAEGRGRAELDELRSKLDRERSRAERELKEVSEGVRDDAENLVMGYAASTVSLIMLAVFAPQVIMACRTKPSALVYGGTAAIYLARELRNSMKFKAKALSEIEYVEVNLDTSKGIGANVETSKRAFNLQFDLMERYIGFLDRAVKSIEEKARSAKMASYGFFAASATAAVETFAFDAGACVEAATTGPSPQETTSFHSLPSSFFHSAERRIEQAQDLGQALAVYYDLEDAIKRGSSSSLSTDDYGKLAQSLNEIELNEELRSALLWAVRGLRDLVFPSAHAEIQVRRYEVSSDLKRREANFAMDVDKVLAILVGGASFAASYFLPSYNLMLRKIVSSGAGRAVVFGAHGGIALAASKQFEESGESMKHKLGRLKNLLEEARSLGNSGFSLIEDALNYEELRKVADELGIDGRLDEASLNDIEEALKKRGLEERLEEAMPELEAGEDFLKNLTSGLSKLFFSEAHAQASQQSNFRLACYQAEACTAPPMPRFQHQALAPLNQVVRDYQAYGQAVYSAQERDLSPFEQRLDQQEQRINQYRQQVYQLTNQHIQRRGGSAINFAQQEARERQQFEEVVKKSLRPGLSDQVVAMVSPRVSPTVQRAASTSPAEQRGTSVEATRTSSRGEISALDYNVLMGLINRLERVIASSDSLSSGESYWPLHPVGVSLFDVIHLRHRRIFAPLYTAPDED